jgi:hypothetical protein
VGDPGRTIIKKNARKFITKESAQKILIKTIKTNPHRKLKDRGVIVEI